MPVGAHDQQINSVFCLINIQSSFHFSLSDLGLDVKACRKEHATAVCNVGPGLGTIIGPAGNFASLPDAAKWLLSIGMLLRRLEILTVLVFITPVFWRY